MKPDRFSKTCQAFGILAVLSLLTLAAFEPIRHNGFVSYDDYGYITQNPYIQDGLTRQSIAWAFTTGYISNWHPLTWISYLLDIELFGLHPLGYHLHNLLLHILATGLLFLVLRNMTGAVWRSALVALAFGLHPLHVESVAWAAERKDVLCAVFWMLSMAAYAGYARRGGVLRYLAVVLCFALGLLSKPMIVTLPFVFLLLDFWPLGRLQKKTAGRGRKRLPDLQASYPCRPVPFFYVVLEKIPFFLMSLTSSVVTYFVQQKWGAVAGLGESSIPDRLSNCLVGYTDYLFKTAWPVNLAVLYPYPAAGWPWWKPVLFFILLICITGFVVSQFRRRPYLPIGWFWYAGTLVPVIGLVQIGKHAIADRYMYLPSIGLFIMVSWGLGELSEKWPYRKAILGTLGGIFTVLLLIGTRIQTATWKEDISLYEHALAVTGDNEIILNNLGAALMIQGRLDEGIVCLDKSLQINPISYDANKNMARALMARRQHAKAEPHYRTVLSRTPEDADIWQEMGNCLFYQRKIPEAAASYKRAIQLDPTLLLSLNNLAWILAAAPDGRIRNPSEAVRLAETMCRLTSYQSSPLLDTLGAAYASAGRLEEAIETSRKALELAQAEKNMKLAEAIAGKLKLYQNGQAYTDPALQPATPAEPTGHQEP